MVYVVAGDVGSGKTLKVLQWMEDYVNAGRMVLTNIKLNDNCPIANRVVLIDTPEYPICAEKPHPVSGYQFFWEYAPEGAAIIIDEGDIHFDSADHRLFGANCKIYHKQHRKFKHDIIYIVQQISNLYKRIRNLAGRFILAEHTYRTLRLMGTIEHYFGRKMALSLSEFRYFEYSTDKFSPKSLRGCGHFTFGEAKKYFDWYDTRQLLGHTERVLKRAIGTNSKARLIDGTTVNGNDSASAKRRSGEPRRIGAAVVANGETTSPILDDVVVCSGGAGGLGVVLESFESGGSGGGIEAAPGAESDCESGGATDSVNESAATATGGNPSAS